MKLTRPLAALALLVASALPALAADAVYPPGLRLGMVPLVGLNTAKTFPGFESEDGGVKVLITELPPAAYGEVVGALNANPAGNNGVKPDKIETQAGLAYFTTESGKAGTTLVKRYSMIVPGTGFSGYVAVQVPENASKIYTDDAVRQMFATAVTRKEVSADEQIGLMPFKITDLAGFKDIRTLVPGSSLILADGNESSGYESKPFIILGLPPRSRPRTAPASPRKPRSKSPACASPASPCPSRSASTASRASRPGSTASAARTRPR